MSQLQPSQTTTAITTIHHGSLLYDPANPSPHPALSAYAKLKADFKSSPEIVLQALDRYYHPHWIFISPSGESYDSPQKFFAEFIGPIIQNFEKYEPKTEWIIAYEKESQSVTQDEVKSTERRKWKVIESTVNVFGFDEKSGMEGEFLHADGTKWSFGIPAMYSFEFRDDGDGRGVRMIEQQMFMDMGELERRIGERGGERRAMEKE